MTTPAPGWYTDPLDETRERYWDGAGWQQETRDPAAPEPPPQSEPAPVASAAAPAPSATDPTSGSSNRKLFVLVAAVAIVAVIAGVFVVSSGGDTPLRLYIHDDPIGSGPVHLVSPGEDLSRETEVIREAERLWTPGFRHPTGVESEGPTVLAYAEEGDERSEVGVVRDGEFLEAFSLRDEELTTSRSVDSDTMLVTTRDRDDNRRTCSAGDDIAELVEIARLDNGSCFLAADGSVVVTGSRDDEDEEFEIEVLTPAGESILRTSGYWRPVLSRDGQYLAVVTEGSRETLEVWDLKSGNETAASMRAEDLSVHGFVGQDVVVSTIEDDRLEVFAISPTGEERELASERYEWWAGVRVFEDAGVAAVTVQEESRTDVTFYAVSSGEIVEDVSGDVVFHLSAPGDDARWIYFVVDGDRVEAFASEGPNPAIQVGAHRFESPSVDWIWFGESAIGYSVSQGGGEGDEGVVVRSVGRSEGSIMFDESAARLQWASPDGRLMLIEVDEGNADELVLLQLGERYDVLDDADSIRDVEVRDGVAYYTAVDGEDYEVRSVALEASARPETLYRDASLVAVDGADITRIVG